MSLIISIIALGLIIAFHEFGHFITARFFKVGVIEFSIGMGPRILSTIKNNTRYSLRVFPFGGSCMMLSEEMLDEKDPDSEGARISDFNNGTFEDNKISFEKDEIIVDGRHFSKDEQFVQKPAWQRFLILFAGPFFNFILAFLFALILTSYYGYDSPYVLEIEQNAPIADSGIDVGDLITGAAVSRNTSKTVHTERIETSRDLQLFMAVNASSLESQDTFILRYVDSDTGEENVAYIQPYYNEEASLYRLGISYNAAYAPCDNISEIIYYSFYDVRYCIKAAIDSIRLLISGNVTRSDVMGPVRIVALMDETVGTAAQEGLFTALMTLINLIILLSGTIGAMNLLPIPALDGGRLLFVLIEIVTRHAVPKELEARVHMAGMLVLLGLMVLIMFNDVTTLIFG